MLTSLTNSRFNSENRDGTKATLICNSNSPMKQLFEDFLVGVHSTVSDQIGQWPAWFDNPSKSRGGVGGGRGGVGGRQCHESISEQN